jgi:hypothetical protein
VNRPSTQKLTAWDKRSSQSVEMIYDGVSRMWLHGAQIVCYGVTTVSRPAIDAWAKAVRELIDIWPKDRPYLAIQDFSEASLTPYIRKQSTSINSAWPADLRGRSAVVMPRNMLSTVMRLFVSHELRPQNNSIEREVFFRIEDATSWLEKGLPADHNLGAKV